MGDILRDLWADSAGRWLALGLVLALAFMAWLIVYAAMHPDPPGTTYTIGGMICLPAGNVVSCTPILEPHYPTEVP